MNPPFSGGIATTVVAIEPENGSTGDHPDEQALLDMSRVTFLIGDTPRVVIDGAFTDD